MRSRPTWLSLTLTLGLAAMGCSRDLTRDAAEKILNENAGRLLSGGPTLRVLQSPVFAPFLTASQAELAGAPLELPPVSEVEQLAQQYEVVRKSYNSTRQQRIQAGYLLALARAGLIKQSRVENVAADWYSPVGIRIYFEPAIPENPEITWSGEAARGFGSRPSRSVDAVATHRSFQGVTGISGEGATREVQVSVQIDPSNTLKRVREIATKFADEQLGGADAYRNSCQDDGYDHLCRALKFPVPPDDTRRYSFRRFDDGWRLDDNPSGAS